MLALARRRLLVATIAVVSAVAFLPSLYIYFVDDAGWHFGGLRALNPIDPVPHSSFRALNVHVVAAVLWTFLSCYQVWTSGRKATWHKPVGWVALSLGLFMTIPAAFGVDDPQMSSCWPIGGLSHDKIMVGGNILFMCVDLVLGVLALRPPVGADADATRKEAVARQSAHMRHMIEAIRSSLAPALMRWLTLVQLVTWVPLVRLVLGDPRSAAERALFLSSGEWFLSKEITYCGLYWIGQLPLAVAGTAQAPLKPANRLATGLRRAFSAYVTARLVLYICLIGLHGGDPRYCTVHFNRALAGRA